MKFEFYVLNYDTNMAKIRHFNIFQNCIVQEESEKAVKKYVRNRKNYKYVDYDGITTYGFDGLCKEIDSILKWQEWSRREYEISVGDAFETDCSKLEKWDCYQQCKPNIPAITREIIHQYKEQLKND